MTKKNKLMEVLGKLSLEIYDHIGGLNFKEESFQFACGEHAASPVIFKKLL